MPYATNITLRDNRDLGISGLLRVSDTILNREPHDDGTMTLTLIGHYDDELYKLFSSIIDYILKETDLIALDYPKITSVKLSGTLAEDELEKICDKFIT